MPKRSLSKRFVERVQPPETGRVEYFDSYVKGFVLRVTATGAKSFAVKNRVSGKQVRVTIGSAAVFDVDEAREKAREILIQMAKGVNPTEEKRRNAGDLDRRFGAVVELFLKKYAEPNQRPRSYSETKRNLENYFVNKWKSKMDGHKPFWKDKDIDEITRADVIARLDEITEKHGLTQANRCFAALRKFYNWVIAARSLVEHSPCDRLAMPAKEKPRDRFFSDAEISKLWKMADAEGYPFGVMFKILLLTGQRRSEVADMTWLELDFNSKFWEIPAVRSKNGEPHVVPLSKQAITLLKSIPQRTDETGKLCPFVFTTNARTPISGFSKAVARMVAAAKLKEPWSLHACRHSVRTALSGLEVPETVIKRVLNHTDVGISSRYNHHRYTEEKRRALQRWADRVDRLLEAEAKANQKVVNLRG